MSRRRIKIDDDDVEQFLRALDDDPNATAQRLELSRAAVMERLPGLAKRLLAQAEAKRAAPATSVVTIATEAGCGSARPAREYVRHEPLLAEAMGADFRPSVVTAQNFHEERHVAPLGDEVAVLCSGARAYAYPGVLTQLADRGVARAALLWPAGAFFSTAVEAERPRAGLLYLDPRCLGLERLLFLQGAYALPGVELCDAFARARKSPQTRYVRIDLRAREVGLGAAPRPLKGAARGRFEHPGP